MATAKKFAAGTGATGAGTTGEGLVEVLEPKTLCTLGSQLVRSFAQFCHVCVPCRESSR